jgi:hypothetical protein
MPRGGKREGSGRKAGGANKKTREIADRALLEGITPLEVMLKAMRLHADKDEWDEAAAFARDAAPYVHPRLASVEHGGKGGVALPLVTVMFGNQ